MRKPGFLFVITALLFAFAANGAMAEIKEGKDYAVLTQPQPIDTKGKVEVIEFFWYGCPHCYDFEPVLGKWLKTLPKDVVFHRVPADFGRWTPGVRLYYALDAIGEEERLHKDLFDAVYRDRMNFNLESEVTDWLVKKGVDRKKFSDAYNSFAVQSKISRAQQMTRTYGLNGVPTVIVGGKYMTSNTMTNGAFEPVVVIMDELIAKARAEQGGKK